MPKEIDLRKAFYEALFEYVKTECGGRDTLAAKRLTIGKNRISVARSAPADQLPRPNRNKMLEPCARHGDPALVNAAQALLDLYNIDAATHSDNEFSFLYAGMQLALAGFRSLLKATIQRQPSPILEELAAQALIELHMSAQYYWGYANHGEKLIPLMPVLLIGSDLWRDPSMPAKSDPNSDGRVLARELLRHAQDDELALARRLDTLSLWKCKTVDKPVEPLELMRAALWAWKWNTAMFHAAHTFIVDAQRHPALKRRPLFKLALELFKHVDRAGHDILTGVDVALAHIHAHDPAEADEALSYVNAFTLCITGNRPFSYMGDRSLVNMTKDGVKLEWTTADKRRPSRVYARPATPVHGADAAAEFEGNLFLLIDEDIYNTYLLDEPPEWPCNNISMLIDHKLNDRSRPPSRQPDRAASKPKPAKSKTPPKDWNPVQPMGLKPPKLN